MNVDFVPHAPTSDVDARVIAVREHTVMGQYQVVALNRGRSAGLEPGHVLAISQAGGVVRDRYSKGGLGARASSVMGGGQAVQLPDERVGLVMVFKAFDRMSYALVMETTHEIRQGDLREESRKKVTRRRGQRVTWRDDGRHHSARSRSHCR